MSVVIGYSVNSSKNKEYIRKHLPGLSHSPVEKTKIYLHFISSYMCVTDKCSKLQIFLKPSFTVLKAFHNILF